MSPIAQSLLAVALISVAMVESAPVDSKSSSTTVKNNGKASKSRNLEETAKSLRRGKRNVIIEEIPDDIDLENLLAESTEEDLLRQQLADLSDDQLAMLANIVQTEVDQYDPSIEAYEVVEIPEYITQPIKYMPRDRRSVQAVLEPYDDQVETDEILFVPDEVLLQQAAEEEQDELELQQRISEIASILNERATRRAIIV